MPTKVLTKDGLTKLTDDLIASLTSDEMVERMKKFKSGTSENPEDFLTVDSVKGAGGYMPKKMRLTSRYFEDDTASGAADKTGTPAIDAIKKIDPSFAAKIENDYPDSYVKLASVDFDGFDADDSVVAVSGCGGAGGAIGGTGGCACGGVKEDAEFS